MVEFEYKNTGIDWLSKFPKHWRIDRIKDHFRDDLKQINEKELSKIEEVAHYSIPSFDENGEPEICTGDSISSGKKVLKGIGVLYSKLNCWKPRVWSYAINKDDILSVASTEFIGLRPIHDNQNDLTYIQYLLCSEAFTSTVKIFLKSVTNSHQRISPETFVSQNIPLPPLPEQKAIADYLDKACKRIDEIIDIKQKQLEKIEGYLGRKIDEIILRGIKDFPKKDSRKDFIGEIPSHYKVHKLKHITKQITDGAHFTPNYLDRPSEDSIPFLRVTDVQIKEIKLKSVKYIDIEEHNELIKRCKPKKGDLLLSKNGTIGITKIVDWDWEFSIFVSLALIKPDRLIDVEYLNYYFKSDIMAYQLHHGSKQITVTNLHLDKIREFYIVTPPIKEQQQIVEKIKLIEHKVNSTKDNINNQITTLQAYRKSLIHECVTGKKQIWEGKIETVS